MQVRTQLNQPEYDFFNINDDIIPNSSQSLSIE